MFLIVTSFMGEVKINVSKLGFCYVVTLINRIKRQKTYISFGVFHVEKPKIDILKGLTNIGTKLIYVFPYLFSHWDHWEQSIAKWIM